MIVIIGVNINSDDQILQDQFVAIENSVIKNFGKSSEFIPEEHIKLIDASGFQINNENPDFNFEKGQSIKKFILINLQSNEKFYFENDEIKLK